MVCHNVSHGQTGLGDVLALAKIEYTAGLEPKITGLKPKIRTRARKPSLGDVLALAKTEYTTGLRIEPKIRTRARKQSYSKPKDKILIAVTASRKKFGSRVAEAVSTWANERNLPSDITLKYFVGDLEKSLPYKSGSDEDIRNLAKEAGIIDLSSIVVMNGVDDNEHPLVGKAVAVIKHMRTIDKSYNKTNGTPEYDWFFDIDVSNRFNFAHSILGFSLT